MISTIIILCAAALILFALYRTIQKFRGRARSSCCGTAEVVTAKKGEDMDASHYPYRYKLGIEGMHCSNCAKSVENVLNSMDGVWARVNLGRGQAEVLSKAVRDEEAFLKEMRKTSYRVVSFEQAN